MLVRERGDSDPGHPNFSIVGCVQPTQARSRHSRYTFVTRVEPPESWGDSLPSGQLKQGHEADRVEERHEINGRQRTDNSEGKVVQASERNTRRDKERSTRKTGRTIMQRRTHM